jgi:ABC-type multidrug transport system fused ATPase/permease subunit
MYEKVGYKWVMVTGWWLAAISLILVLVSFLFSIESYKETIALWKEKKENLNSMYAKFMNTCTCIATFLSFLAIAFSLIFFTFNFLFMSDNTSKTFVENTHMNVQKNSEPVSAGISPTEFFA